MENKTILLLSVFMIVMLAAPAYSYWGPRAVLTETIEGSYTVNSDDASSGTPAASTRVGYIDVYVPNTDDVLQYVRLNLSSNTPARTNIELWNGSVTSYRDYAMSNPTLATATRMYLNTSAGNQQLTYIPDFNYAPSLNISMTVTNARGGDDLYDEDDIIGGTNLLQFNFSIVNYATQKTFHGSDITYTIRFNHSAGPDSNSSVSIVTDPVVVGQGSAARYNDDGDASNDRVTWTGTLGPGEYAYITFNGTALGGENYVSTLNKLGLGGYGANALYTNTSDVISEITFTGRFARGPIREGVDMMEAAQWRVKTYITSMANDSVASGEHSLTYNISSWRIYNVTALSGAIDQMYGSYNDTLNYALAAGLQYRIPSWVSTESSKPYIAPYFDWHVFWNDTNYYTYSGKVNFSMVLPTLYELDTFDEKYTNDVFTPEIYGDEPLMTYNITAYHTGNSDLDVSVGKLQIISVIPNTDTTGLGFAQLNVSNVRVYYKHINEQKLLSNGDTSHMNIAITNTTPTSNGTLIVTISNLGEVEKAEGGVFGANMTNGDYVTVQYAIYAHENSTGSSTSGVRDQAYFDFAGNYTLWTMSGTYMVYNSTDVKQASQNSIGAYKQLISSDPSNPQLVDVTINLSVINHVDNVKLVDYIPHGMSNTSVVVMTSDKYSITYNRTYIGTITTSDGVQMDAYEITNSTDIDGWDFDDDGHIAFTYQLELTSPGLYVLPVQVAAFDPGLDNGVSLTRYGVIKYTVPEKVQPLSIDDAEELKLLSAVTVGKPALWRKSFIVYNPNSGKTPAEFRTEVFKDAVEVYATYYDDYGQKIEESVDLDRVGDTTYAIWGSTLNPRESRSYELRVLTPPAVEVDRNVDVLEKLENKHVKIEAEIVIKNFAEESYDNLKMNLNIPLANIFSIEDAFGNAMVYTGDSSTTTVSIPSLAADNVLSLKVVYKQSYPTVIITPAKERYDTGEVASLEVLIINGGDKIVNPSIETEIYTENMDLLYADLKRLETTLKPLETTELSTKFLLPVEAPTGRYIANVRFGEDFTPITESSINFYVLGSSSDTTSNAKIIILIVLAAVLIYLAYKRIVRVKKNE